MKKVLCILGAVAIVAAFSTSCNKKCTCKVNGSAVAVTYDLKQIKDLTGIDIKKCSELNFEGWECK